MSKLKGGYVRYILQITASNPHSLVGPPQKEGQRLTPPSLPLYFLDSFGIQVGIKARNEDAAVQPRFSRNKRKYGPRFGWSHILGKPHHILRTL